MKLRATLTVFLMALSFQAWAQSDGDTAATAAAADTPRAQRFSVKLGAIDYKYEEPGLMKIHGRLYELQTAYRSVFHWGSWPMLYGARLSLASGTTTYDGGLAHGSVVTPASNPSNDKILNFEGLFGTALIATEHHELDVYSGPALWLLFNKIDGDGSYSRQISYIYMPVGLGYALKFGAFKFTLGAQYDAFIAGIAQSSLSDLGSSYSDTSNNQSKGSGMRLSAGVEYGFSGWALTTDAYYKTWDIADSDSQYSAGAYWREPHNTTKMLGVNLGARF